MIWIAFWLGLLTVWNILLTVEIFKLLFKLDSESESRRSEIRFAQDRLDGSDNAIWRNFTALLDYLNVGIVRKDGPVADKHMPSVVVVKRVHE